MKKKNVKRLFGSIVMGVVVLAASVGQVGASGIEFSDGADENDEFSTGADDMTESEVPEESKETDADIFVDSDSASEEFSPEIEKEEDLSESQNLELPEEDSMDIRAYWDDFLESDSEVVENASAGRAGGMTTGESGYALIKQFESCRLTAYKAVSTEKYYTIGWGHYGADVYAGMTITQEQADRYLVQDVAGSQAAVNSFLSSNGITIGQAQFDALVSFTYNCGNVWVSTPTFQLKTILKNGYTKYSDAQIRTAFTNWNKSGGQVLAGLTRRRNAEADLFLSSKSDTCNCSESYAGNYTVTTSQYPLSIRSGHGTSYGKIGQIPSGETVYVSRADGNWAHVEYNGVSGYCSMEYLSKKADVNIIIQGWFSTTAMGDSLNGCNSGDDLYLCYKLYDSNSGKNWNEIENKNYSVKETVYNPDGSEKFSHTYNNSDNNWIKIIPDKGGNYRGKIELTGDREGAVECSIPVTLRHERFGGWLTSDAVGNNRITTIKKNQQVYLWYKVYDNNTGMLLNQYRNWTYTMQQIVYKPDGTKVLERTYNNSDNGVLSFVPDAVGQYKCKTIITLSNGNPQINTTTLNVENSEIQAALITDSAGSAVSGGQVRLTANASGGTGNYTYKFIICDARGNWYKLRDYGNSNSIVWIPGASGKKTLYADVKDSSGTVKRVSTVFEVRNRELNASLALSPSGSAVSGSQVRLTANASGGTGNYTYKFIICDARGNWYKLRDYGTSNSITWIPGASGKKTLYVDVKDSSGTVKRVSTVFEVRNRELNASFALSPSGSAVSGSRVKLTANASGGTGNYMYKFLICDIKGNWYKLQDFSTKNSAIWIPNTSGEKTVYLYVKDSSGRVISKEMVYVISR